MDTVSLKAKGKLTREDIGKLLASIGEPGKKRKAKFAAVESLGLVNPSALGGHGVELTLESYKEY